jgi:hypothetical protein
MKKTLLVTSALVGLVASSAVAQTTVSGSLEIISRNTTFDGTAATKQKSDSFLGRESQINIQNKGKLNVGGLDYAAGFSLEFDGGQTTAEGSSANTTISNENLYIDIINASSATTLTFGIDHIQNSKNTGLKTVTDFIDDVGDAVISSNLISLGAKTKEYMGVGITQGLGASNLTASYFYAPNASNLGGGDTGSATNLTSDNAAYEYGVKGNDVFGVKGLALEYWKNNRAKNDVADRADSTGRKYAVNYTYGDVTVGAIDAVSENGTYAATTNIKNDTRLYSVSYAVNKDLSLSVIKGKTDITNTGTPTAEDETYKALQVGYNLGPVGVAAAYTKVSDLAGAEGQDAEQLSIRLSTKF